MVKDLDIVITQTLMKDMSGDKCPLFLQGRWIDKTVEWSDTEAMAWGRWFEYQILGGTAKDEVPELTPKMEKSVTYKRALIQIEKWKEVCETMDIKIDQAQEYVEQEVMMAYNDTAIPIKIGGTFDVRGTVKGRKAIIDVKTTADISMSFGEFGWGNLANVDMKQGVHYPLLAKMKYGEEFDFYYIIFDWKPTLGVKIVKVECTQDALDKHLNDVFNVWAKLYVGINEGFEADPSYLNCKQCPLNSSCKSAIKFPEIEIVKL